MGLSIRLKRLGSNQRPFYRVVVSDSQCPPKGQALEGIGCYDPLAKDKPLRIDTARVAELRKQRRDAVVVGGPAAQAGGRAPEGLTGAAARSPVSGDQKETDG